MAIHDHDNKKPLCPVHYAQEYPTPPEDDIFCSICGRQLVSTCPSCQTYEDEDDKIKATFASQRAIIKELTTGKEVLADIPTYTLEEIEKTVKKGGSDKLMRKDDFEKIKTVTEANGEDPNKRWELNQLQHIISLGYDAWKVYDDRRKNEEKMTQETWKKIYEEAERKREADKLRKAQEERDKFETDERRKLAMSVRDETRKLIVKEYYEWIVVLNNTKDRVAHQIKEFIVKFLGELGNKGWGKNIMEIEKQLDVLGLKTFLKNFEEKELASKDETTKEVFADGLKKINGYIANWVKYNDEWEKLKEQPKKKEPTTFPNMQVRSLLFIPKFSDDNDKKRLEGLTDSFSDDIQKLLDKYFQVNPNTKENARFCRTENSYWAKEELATFDLIKKGILFLDIENNDRGDGTKKSFVKDDFSEELIVEPKWEGSRRFLLKMSEKKREVRMVCEKADWWDESGTDDFKRLENELKAKEQDLKNKKESNPTGDFSSLNNEIFDLRDRVIKFGKNILVVRGRFVITDVKYIYDIEAFPYGEWKDTTEYKI